MTADATSPNPPAARDEQQLPTREQVLDGAAPHTLDELTQRLKAAFAERELPLKPFTRVKAGRQERWFKSELPVPWAPDEAAECLVVAAVGRWTEERTDAFIAEHAHLRLGPGLPRFRFYSEHPLPPELRFLFETLDAGTFEISAWEIVEGEALAADECAELAQDGRRLIRDLYGVDLDADDLQWISFAQQLIDDELRWFSDEPDAHLPEGIDYVPYAALLLLGTIAGEAVRLNHPDDLLWTDGDGDNWPRIGIRGKPASLAIIDAIFERFEAGVRRDVWELYKVFSSGHHLPPPVTFDAIVVDPLEFLPRWDPAPDQPIHDALQRFHAICAEASIGLEPHPLTPGPEDMRELAEVHAFTTLHNDQRYDMFVATAAWTEARAAAFVKVWGHRSLDEWEVGGNPVFVFFSGHPLTPLLEYCFIDGPAVAPLEGLARVETPSPQVPADASVIEPLATWLLDALERYTTIGLDLRDGSVLPGLSYFLREEFSQATGAQAPADADLHTDVYDMDHYGTFEPEALLTAVGLTAGESLRQRDPRHAAWVLGDAGWPVLRLTSPHNGATPHTIDWIAQARAIWRGEQEEFRSSP